MSSDDQMGGGDHLRVARSEPRRVVVAVGLGVAGNVTGDELCGCRSSSEAEPVARGHGKGRAVVLRVSGDAVSVVYKVGWPERRR